MSRDKRIAEQDAKLAEQYAQLAKRDAQLAKRDAQLRSLAQALLQKGIDTVGIATIMGLSQEEVGTLLKE